MKNKFILAVFAVSLGIQAQPNPTTPPRNKRPLNPEEALQTPPKKQGCKISKPPMSQKQIKSALTTKIKKIFGEITEKEQLIEELQQTSQESILSITRKARISGKPSGLIKKILLISEDIKDLKNKFANNVQDLVSQTIEHSEGKLDAARKTAGYLSLPVMQLLNFEESPLFFDDENCEYRYIITVNPKYQANYTQELKKSLATEGY